QTKRDGLHASGGQAAADFVPEKRRNLVTDDAVKYAASLLRVDQMHIDGTRLLEGSANRLGRDFVKGDAEDFLGINRRDADFVLILSVLLGGFALGSLAGFLRLFFGLGILARSVPVAVLGAGQLGFLIFAGFGKHHGQVLGDGFTFTVRVARQI